jgi:hypothetical protein
MKTKKKLREKIAAKRARIARAKILKAERIEADKIRLTAELEVHGEPPSEIAAVLETPIALETKPLELEFGDYDHSPDVKPAKHGFWDWLLG